MTVRSPIPVAEPWLGEPESRFVNDALQKKAISGFFGEYIEEFETTFARYCGTAHAVAVSNGTTALHLAMIVSDIGPGDEVLVSTYTNMASFFAVLYTGATPVAVDSDPETWNLDPSLLEALVTPRTKAILVVHIFGHPVDMAPIWEVAERHGLRVIEDCAEAHGATYEGRKVGALGDIGCFSFYANKIITTGEGGMLTTDDAGIAERARSVRSLAFGRTNKFMHREIGYNYRMTNVQAAIGCAQMTRIEEIIACKRSIAVRYNAHFSGHPLLRLPVEKAYARNVYWMYHLVLEPGASVSRDDLMTRLAERGVESRPGFLPFDDQEIFIERGIASKGASPVASYIGANSLYLPSGPLLPDAEIDYVAATLLDIVRPAATTVRRADPTAVSG